MKLIDFPPGDIRFVSGVPGQPETRSSETRGVVTINTVNAEVEAEPAHFLTGHFIAYSHEIEGMEVRNTVRIETIVPQEDPETPYQAVEDAAARSLPALLRSLVDALQADIDRADRDREARQQ